MDASRCAARSLAETDSSSNHDLWLTRFLLLDRSELGWRAPVGIPRTQINCPLCIHIEIVTVEEGFAGLMKWLKLAVEAFGFAAPGRAAHPTDGPACLRR